jgi:hypothetical protein
MVQTLAFNARLPVLLGASPFYQTPNAPIARGLQLNETDFVKARLTALAIETEHFTRDDIYTLFVTTRILNFLKGLPVTDAIALVELIVRFSPDARTRIGFQLLRQLASSGRLYAWTSNGLIKNERFKPSLLKKALTEMNSVITQSGGSIAVGEFKRELSANDSYGAVGNRYSKLGTCRT